MPKADFDRLLSAIGFKTVDPGSAAKVIKAKALVQAFNDIVIGWDVAIQQFDEAKMPRLVGELYGALDNLDQLHPHCRGALLSLVFNCGSGGFTASGDRYRELREIRRLMTAGTRADFKEIPAQLISMQRNWGEKPSLAQRQSEEADLFEQGVHEADLSESRGALVAPPPLEPVVTLVEDHTDTAQPSDAGDPDGEAENSNSLLTEAIGPTLADVKWNPNDDEQPDYRHLPKLAPGQSST